MKARWMLIATLTAVAVAMLALAGAVWAAVISNSSPISIPDSGRATPYPATVNVSGLSGTITDVNVTLRGVRHTWPDDVSALLVGPGGQKVMLMSDVGGASDLNGIDLTLDDEAAGRLPEGSRIYAGTYKPTQGTSADGGNARPASLPSPAPAGPYGTSLSAFDGAAPNGTYSLYVFDDSISDAGQVAGGLSLDIKTTAAAPAADLLPDLRMARLQNLQIQKTASGSKLLRFDSIIVNVGAERFEARGSRPDTSARMAVTQRVFNDQGGYRDRATTAQMYFAGDGHTHWHLRDLETYELVRLDNGVKVGTGAKHGFCFYDNYRFGSDQPAYYADCGRDPNALQVRMGLSKGWGDIYWASLPDQYIDVTGLTSGRYRLRAIADEADWFSEVDNSNNVTWVDIQLSNTSVSVLSYGPSA